MSGNLFGTDDHAHVRKEPQLPSRHHRGLLHNQLSFGGLEVGL